MDRLQSLATGLKTRIETPSFQQSVAFYTELIGMTVLDSWNEAGDEGAILGPPTDMALIRRAIRTVPGLLEETDP